MRSDKHIKFTDLCVDIMDDMIATEPDVRNYSEAVRVALMAYSGEKQASEFVALKRKLNQVSAELSTVTAMVAGGFAECEVSEIPPLDECAIYHVAKARVSQEIQKAITSRSGKKGKSIRASIDG